MARSHQALMAGGSFADRLSMFCARSGYVAGDDPFIVLDSDNLAETVKAAVAGRMGNAGQACTAAKRMIVVGDLYDEFVAQFTAAMAALRPGDPTDPASDLGPLSSESAAERLMGQIRDAVDQGATLRTGGKRSTGWERSWSLPS